MKWYLGFILLSVAWVPTLIVAAPPGMESATVQSFQEADQHQSASTQPQSMHSVQKDVRPNNNEKLSSKASQPDSYSMSAFQAELLQMNQLNLQFQQQMSERLVDLNISNHQLQEQVKGLQKAVMTLSQEVLQFKQGSATLSRAPSSANPLKTSSPQSQKQSQLDQTSKSASLSSWFNVIDRWLLYLKSLLGQVGYKVAVGALIFILLLLVWALWPSKKKAASPSPNQDSLDIEGEYDYMGSAESIPAKINLARTYIAMDELKAAREVLEQVLQHGNEAQSQEANDLLKEFPAES